MPFNLEVAITGLCLFKAEKDVMRVLMLHPTDVGMKHTAYLVYNADYESDSGAGDVVLPLDDKPPLDLSGYAGDPAQLTVPPELIIISRGAFPKITNVQAAAADHGCGLLTLPPGTATTFRPKGPWRLRLFEPTQNPMPGHKEEPHDYDRTLVAWNVIWTVTNIQQDDLHLPGGKVLKPRPNDPIRGANWIKLLVCNGPVTEDKITRLPDSEGLPAKEAKPHFAAYWSLYPDSTAGRLTWNGGYGEEKLRTTAYTCVPSGGH